MLKQTIIDAIELVAVQPPSGGCVLKQVGQGRELSHWQAAAFGRLCVETADWVI